MLILVTHDNPFGQLQIDGIRYDDDDSFFSEMTRIFLIGNCKIFIEGKEKDYYIKSL